MADTQNRVRALLSQAGGTAGLGVTVSEIVAQIEWPRIITRGNNNPMDYLFALELVASAVRDEVGTVLADLMDAGEADAGQYGGRIVFFRVVAA